MWNSYDLDEVRRLFLDDSRLTYFSSEREGVIRGMDAILEHHRGFGFVSGGVSKPSRLWLEGLETDTFGDFAVVTGLWYFQADAETDALPQKGPVTFVAVWTAGEWRFVHLNFSNYFQPETL
jgi:ketosteroid isomerase-like protein